MRLPTEPVLPALAGGTQDPGRGDLVCEGKAGGGADHQGLMDLGVC